MVYWCELTLLSASSMLQFGSIQTSWIQLWSITNIAFSCFCYLLLLRIPYLGLDMLMTLYPVRPELTHVGHGQRGHMFLSSVYTDVHLKFDVLIFNASTKSLLEPGRAKLEVCSEGRCGGSYYTDFNLLTVIRAYHCQSQPHHVDHV